VTSRTGRIEDFREIGAGLLLAKQIPDIWLDSVVPYYGVATFAFLLIFIALLAFHGFKLKILSLQNAQTRGETKRLTCGMRHVMIPID
jgi:hypothetical protein